MFSPPSDARAVYALAFILHELPTVQDPEVIVVGSGPNGLAAAITMAQAGRSVLVLEANDDARRRHAHRGAHAAGLPSRRLLGDPSAGRGVAVPRASLPLEEHGVEWIEPPVPVAHPLDGGRAVALQRSLDATVDALGPDGRAYRELIEPALEVWQDLLGEPAAAARACARYSPRALRFGAAALLSAERSLPSIPHRRRAAPCSPGSPATP